MFCLHEVDTLRTVVRKKTTHIQEKLTGEYLSTRILLQMMFNSADQKKKQLKNLKTF